MKIIITSLQSIENEFNGVACHVTDLSKSLREKGYEVQFVTPYHSKNALSVWFSRARRFFYGLSDKTGFSFPYLCVLAAIWLETYLKLKKISYDVIDAQDVITASAAILASDESKPIVLTCHFWEKPWEEFVDGNYIGKNTVSYNLLARLIRRTIKNPKLNFVCVSEKNFKKLKEINSNANKRACVIYNGVEPPNIIDVKSILPEDRKIIVNVGKLEKRKNQVFLVEVANELVKAGYFFNFVLVGPEEAGEKIFIEKMIIKYDLQKYFYFFGSQERDVVFSVIKNSFIYFHTSIYESLGMTLLEALSVGTPVIALAYDGLREILDEIPETIINANATPEEAAQKIIEFEEGFLDINDILLRQQIIFSMKFSLKAMASNYELFYNFLSSVYLEKKNELRS
ncbi:glycosyltransferase family 4 protein [bacterium]|nr:glycosyltransferase family 4 protein [bacterium]